MGIHKLQRLLAVILTAALLVTTNMQAALAFSVGEEKEVGEKLLYAVRASFPILDDPDLHQYITDIGHEVLDVAGVQFFDYHFYIVESS